MTTKRERSKAASDEAKNKAGDVTYAAEAILDEGLTIDRCFARIEEHARNMGLFSCRELRGLSVSIEGVNRHLRRVSDRVRLTGKSKLS